MRTKGEAQLTCPHCSATETVEIPQDGCLPFYECSTCGELISVPEDSDDCCVICAYSNTTCPVGNKNSHE